MSTTPKTAEDNPFVRRCVEAWDKAYSAAFKQYKDEDEDQDEDDAVDAAQDSGDEAYCEAMPPLLGVRNIRNYFVCVAHGVSMGAIAPAKASRLLYAAQLAWSTRRIREPKDKKPRSSSKNSESKQSKKPGKEPLEGPLEPLNPALEPLPATSQAA